jgi:maltoporin
MKKYIAMLAVSITAATLTADEKQDNLRSEFDTYKKTTEARITALEQKLNLQKTASAKKNKKDKNIRTDVSNVSLTEREISEIREQMERAAMDFDFYGYFRSGLGVDDSGNTQSTFQAPNAEAKYRLGNEAETYVETGFANKLGLNDNDNNTGFNSYVLLAYVTPHNNNNNYEATTSLREVFAEATGVMACNPSAALWAGQRFYSRYDIHMNDFYYRDMSGFGGGVERVTLPDGHTHFSAAWIGGSIDKLSSNGTGFQHDDGRFNKNNLDMSLTEMPVPGGTLNTHLTISRFEGDAITNSTGTLDLDSTWGAAISLMYTTLWGDDGKNIISAQYGQGAAYNFRSQITSPTQLDDSSLTEIDVSELSTIRFLDNIIWDINERWTLQGVAIYQNSDLGTSDNIKSTWFSLGFRPAYHFNRFFSLETELGYDYTDKDEAESGSLFKVTIAPQITPQAKVFSRPSIRMFLTYAVWSNEFEGMVALPSYKKDNDGISAGVQVESWF